MIRAFAIDGDKLRSLPAEDPLTREVIWYDLLNPTLEEERRLEAHLELELPTRDEMQEIELSSRLYAEDGGIFMTALVPSRTDSEDPIMAPVTFILAQHRLVTIRYHEPRAFESFPRRAEKTALGCTDGEAVLLALLDAIVDRLADVLEHTGREVDVISRTVFGQKGAEGRKGGNYKATLEEIGRKGDLTSNIRDCLVTLDRVVGYLGPRLRGSSETRRAQIDALVNDLRSLSDHSVFMAQKITFLLDATLGLINIEQNAIIKIFSVAAVVFLPPTLVASIYGMNFQFMPELGWKPGYPMAIVMMILSAVLPYIYFKRRGWL